MYKLIFFAVSLAVAVSSPVWGEIKKPAFGGDFKFRSLAPPKPDTKKRMTIQIEPDFDPFPKAPSSPTKPTEQDSGAQTSWFWSVVSAQREAAGSERFLQAAEFLERSDQTLTLKSPRLAQLQKIVDAHGRTIMAETLGTKVSPAFVLSLIAVESGGREAAVSSKGAQGLMQLIPDTAKRFGVENASDPVQNIAGGVKYLDWLLKEFNNDPLMALAGYNAGENAVRKYEGVPPFAETRAYVPKVLAAWNLARGLCLTPPLLTSDGCVFRLSPEP